LRLRTKGTVQNKRKIYFSFETEQKVQHTSCGAIYGSTVVLIDEGESEQGQVLLIGGLDEHGVASSAVHLVDLATGGCTAQASLLSPQGGRIENCQTGALSAREQRCI
jgi:hypothetical protein